MDPSAPPHLEKPPPYSPCDPKVHGSGKITTCLEWQIGT